MRNELTEIQPFLQKNLIKYFDIEREIRRGKYIADFILTCKVSGIKLGVECKARDVVKGSEVFDWIMQARQYSEVFGIPFFVFPHIQNRVFYDGVHKNLSHGNNVSTFLGRLGVGELLCEVRENKKWIERPDGGFYPPKITNFFYFKFVHSSYVIWANPAGASVPNTDSYDRIQGGQP